ncbi:hypothetical protein K435DRAFT_656014 [Dendrothele bispora CBS 962.96]|uniref:DUF6593 domain-containing protein n=1 Tax=Dendrothele bispora (strain CBS 962.96) TaxID=1314807 RepID=A0A4V4HH32_DENBC|nr:hypothetical protein K435DRAFT_656014 [Dendrothele bispora CBS 962.96]
MKLYQKKQAAKAVLNNTYYDDSGRIVYKVHTPVQFHNHTTTIAKFLSPDSSSNSGSSQTPAAHGPSTSPTPPEHFKFDDVDELESGIKRHVTDEEDADNEMDDGFQAKGEIPNVFVYLAQIDWRVKKGNVFRFGDGKEVAATKFLRKDKWRERVFTASDGAEYKWVLGLTTSELFINTSPATPIAKFHGRKSGILNPNRVRAHLEIYPAGQHIADEIFLTFVYVEKIRRQ